MTAGQTTAMSAAARPRPARYGRRKITNVVFVTLTSLATLVAVVALVLILWSLVVRGVGGINALVFTADTPGGGGDLGTGGLRNAIVGSLMTVGVGMVVALVIGILAGTWLAEYGDNSQLAAAVRFLNDVLLSAPSILVGLFIYELLVIPFHGGSALAGAMALAVLTTPVVTRTTEDILRLQTGQLREAGMALGAGKGLVTRAIIWRASRSGLTTGGLLGFARMSGESAPLIFTNAGNQFFSLNLFGVTASLPMTIFYFALSADENWQRLAWVAALLIAVTVLTANVLGREFARRSQQK